MGNKFTAVKNVLSKIEKSGQVRSCHAISVAKSFCQSRRTPIEEETSIAPRSVEAKARSAESLASVLLVIKRYGCLHIRLRNSNPISAQESVNMRGKKQEL